MTMADTTANVVTDGDEFDFELDEFDNQGKPAHNEDGDPVTWVLAPEAAGTYTINPDVSRKGHFVTGDPTLGATLTGTTNTGYVGVLTFNVNGGDVVSVGVSLSNVTPKAPATEPTPEPAPAE